MASGTVVEIVAIVSSDPHLRLGSRELLASPVARSVQLYRTGAELLNVLALDPRFRGAVVVVDAHVEDIAPLNLVDALRSTNLGIDIVVALTDDNSELVNRAMLAGARAAVRRGCSDADLELAIQRVVAARPNFSVSLSSSTESEGERGSVVAFVGARGGAGRSTLSSLVASLAARGGVDTGLLDFDLQYGDLSLLYGGSSDPTLYSMAQGAEGHAVPEGFGRTVFDNLTLYTPAPSPETVELLSGRVAQTVDALASRHKLLVVSTGAYWTLLHAELLETSDQIVCVLDQTVPGVRATVALADQLDHLSVAGPRRLFLVNRTRPLGVSPKEIARALSVEQVWTVPDGGPEVALAMDAGGVDLVLDTRSGVVPAALSLLEEIAMRESLPIRSVQTVRQQMGKKRGRWTTTCRR